MKHKVGDKVVFVGRASEQGKYHPDYQQLMYSVGTVVSDDMFTYQVSFEGFELDGDNIYVCFRDEVVAAP